MEMQLQRIKGKLGEGARTDKNVVGEADKNRMSNSHFLFRSTAAGTPSV